MNTSLHVLMNGKDIIGLMFKTQDLVHFTSIVDIQLVNVHIARTISTSVCNCLDKKHGFWRKYINICYHIERILSSSVPT